MIKLKLKVADKVQVTAGEHKGAQGAIVSLDKVKNRAIVEGVNLVSKHQKPSSSNPQGGIAQKEAPIHISNLSLLDPKDGSPTRVGYEVRDGKKVRVSKKSNEVL